MHLRSISLVGFKSFADRTRLVFEPGVTVVVGPNGSGKSNLVDAIAWVMGTQATKSLRTEKMEDVIFAGTTLRPSLGRAEVRLTFDNSDGRVPLDLSEVTVGRRLYRDGTSEYEINGTGCRLLDIQELLSDSGVGRHQHIVVGQGRVEEVLSAGPDEHRAIIEEAAGVIKHRQRRDRAVRRLDATALDVQRLEDLLAELQRRLRPLRRQAKAFERYEDTKQRWRDLRLWVGGERLRAVRHRMAAVGAGQQSGRHRLAGSEAELAALRLTLAELQDEARRTGRDLERDSAAAARLETAVERFQRIAMVARERRAALESRLAGGVERRADLEREVAELRAALADAVVDEQELRDGAEREEAALMALEDEERSLAGQHLLPPEGVLATARGDLAALEAAERRDLAELGDIERRRQVVQARIDEEAEEIARLGLEIRDSDAAAAPAHAAYGDAMATRQREEAAFEEAEEALGAARRTDAAARARLEALETAMAGPGDAGARRRASEMEEVAGTLVSLLDVPESLTAAADAALAGWTDALVARSRDGLARVIGAVKGSGDGGVGLVATPPDAAAPARTVAAAVGLEALVDLLGPDADAELADAVLGDVVIVEGWQAGWTLVGRHPEVRAVTPEGDLITATGIRASDAEGAGRAALEAAAVGVERAETEVARAASRQHAARRAFERARDRERDGLEAVEAVEARIGGATEALRLVDRSRSELEAERSRLDARGRAIDEAQRGRAERMEEVRRRIKAVDGGEAQAAWDDLERRRSDVARRRDRARRARQEAAGAHAAVQERCRMIERRLDEVVGLLRDLGGGDGDPADVERLTGTEQRARRALAAVRAHLAVLRDRQRRLRTAAGEGGERLEESEVRRDRLEQEIAELKEGLAALAVEAAELGVREESVAEGLRRDVDADEELAMAALRPGLGDGENEEEALASLEAELRRLGPVNPLAAAEFRELSEREEFLAAQLEDLASSRRELRSVIDALDAEIARLFRDAFSDIAAAFEENFTVLFPGGRGRLALTDPGNPLSSGVSMSAQPFGKKVGSLGLLSGGERSLAALAFLFAVFRARPSPFYVLDEVEAALDDANLRRFIRLIGTLRETSQLVIVTHQQQTMEAADILYGVTMEPGETSRVLAKRLVHATA